MAESLDQLKKDSLLVILTYASAGLGHLRVTDALYEGLPKGVKPLLLTSQDEAINGLHRLTSIHPILRKIMEWVQRGELEDIFTYFYRLWLTKNTKTIYNQMMTIINQRADVPKQILLVSTHFSLAHQLAEIKNQLEREIKVKIFLAVQVTDDSPQHIWLVPGADLIFVPSGKTKSGLKSYEKQSGFKKTPIKISAYPMNPKIVCKLTKKEFKNKKNQLDPAKKTLANVIIPISGAAVGLGYFLGLIKNLSRQDKFRFLIISRCYKYTKKFLSRVKKMSACQIFSHKTDRGVVDVYEKVYQQKTISLEITKPSEQAFKALVEPDKNGGAILLFCQAVGRQEYDNLKFLDRHNLIPCQSKQNWLWRRSKQDKSLTVQEKKEILKTAQSWRGIKLPKKPSDSAQFINWCLKEGIFQAMLKAKLAGRVSDKNKNELNADGVRIFWQEIVQLLN